MSDYSFMEEAIRQFVLNYGVRIVLPKDVFKSTLNVYVYNWIGGDDRYYSLLVPCSTNMVYYHDAGRFVQETSSLQKAMISNLLVFTKKEDWDAGHWTADFAKGYVKTLEKFVLCRKGISGGGKYSITGIQLHVQPMIGISVWYVGAGMDCITVWCGYVKKVVTTDSEYRKFLESLNFEGMLEIEGPNSGVLLLEDADADNQGFD